MRQFRGSPPGLVCFYQTFKRLVNRVRKHGELRAALLLLQNKQRLAEIRIAPANLLAQDSGLRVLASQAEHRRPGNIRMIDVAGDEAAKVVGILPRSPAAAFMQ